VFSASPWTSAEGARSLFGHSPRKLLLLLDDLAGARLSAVVLPLKRLLDVLGCRLADLLDDLLVDLRGPRSETLITLV
jgi:hypothetical protein